MLGGLFLCRFDILWYLCTGEVYPLSGTAAQLELATLIQLDIGGNYY